MLNAYRPDLSNITYDVSYEEEILVTQDSLEYSELLKLRGVINNFGVR